MTIERTEAQMQAQAEMDRRRAEEQDAWRELSEWVGLPLICPARSCRRAGRCTGQPSARTRGLHPCLKHYREEVRFLLDGPDGLTERLPERGRAADAASAQRLTLIEAIYGTGREALDRLRRPKG